MKLWFPRAIMAFVLALSTTAWADPASLNLATTLSKTKAKLAANGQADILVIGDSLSYADGCYLPVFRDLLQAHYGDAGAGYQAFSMWTGGGVNSGWSGGILSEDISPHYGLDGLWVESNTGHDIGYLTAQSPTIQLQYLAQPGGASFRPFLDVNGVPQYLSAAISTDSAVKEVRTWTYTIPNFVPGMQIWYNQQMAGTVTLLGENNTNSNPGIRIHRAANGGYKVTNYLQRDPSFDQQLGLVNPDMVMIMLGANDAGTATGPEFKSELSDLIDRIYATDADADILLVTPYDLRYETGANDLHYQRVVVPEEELANELGIGFLNLHDYAGDYSMWIANNYLVDGIHQTFAGGNYLGNLIYNAFMTDGASLVPEPTCMALLLPGLLGLYRRPRR